MKKVLVLALGMLLIPFTAFGMQAMSDSDLESITGQSGVAISLENVQVYNHMEGEQIWFETGGNAVGIVYDAAETYTYLTVTNLDYTIDNGGNFITVNKLDDTENPGLARGEYSPLEEDGDLNASDLGMPVDPKVLTIRVTDTQVIDGDRMFYDDNGDDPIAYVEIGLPTLELVEAEGSKDIMSIYVVNSDDPLEYDFDADDPVERIGRIHSSGGGSTTAIFGGRIGITSRGNVHEDNINQPAPW